MIISSCFAYFCKFSLSLTRFSKFYSRILDPFEFWKFQTRNQKAMAKVKKANIAVTLSVV
jgi:hypothetical protein